MTTGIAQLALMGTANEISRLAADFTIQSRKDIALPENIARIENLVACLSLHIHKAKILTNEINSPHLGNPRGWEVAG